MKADFVQDPKVRNAVIIARDAHNRGVSFSKAIQDAAKFCKADVEKVKECMLKIIGENNGRKNDKNS